MDNEELEGLFNIEDGINYEEIRNKLKKDKNWARFTNEEFEIDEETAMKILNVDK